MSSIFWFVLEHMSHHMFSKFFFLIWEVIPFLKCFQFHLGSTCHLLGFSVYEPTFMGLLSILICYFWCQVYMPHYNLFWWDLCVFIFGLLTRFLQLFRILTCYVDGHALLLALVHWFICIVCKLFCIFFNKIKKERDKLIMWGK